jgi:uncharacterized protein
VKPGDIGRIGRAEGFWTRLVGLMGRRRWPSRYEGLLFPRCRSIHTFFTFLRPDLVFLDKDEKILKIVPSARPWRVFLGPRGCLHCLELPRGRAVEFRLEINDRLGPDLETGTGLKRRSP